MNTQTLKQLRAHFARTVPVLSRNFDRDALTDDDLQTLLASHGRTIEARAGS